MHQKVDQEEDALVQEQGGGHTGPEVNLPNRRLMNQSMYEDPDVTG